MEGKRVIVLGILLFFICCIALMTLWLGGAFARGTGGAAPVTVPATPARPGTAVESVGDIPDMTIDPAWLQATPHWLLIVAGKKEQAALIGYIENSSVSAEQKAAWEATLSDVWSAYPVKAVPSAQGTLVTCDCDLSALQLTGPQNATLRDIEMQIALDMENASRAMATPTGGGL